MNIKINGKTFDATITPHVFLAEVKNQHGGSPPTWTTATHADFIVTIKERKYALQVHRTAPAVRHDADHPIEIITDGPPDGGRQPAWAFYTDGSREFVFLTDIPKPAAAPIGKPSPDGAAIVLRESAVFSPGNMPPGPVGDAYRALTKDQLQILNLRFSTNAKGKNLSWREVADRFEREGNAGRRYTPENCRQIYVKVLRLHPSLQVFCTGLKNRTAAKLEAENELTDHDEIEAITDPKPEFELSGEDTGYRITTSPRKPLKIGKFRR